MPNLTWHWTVFADPSSLNQFSKVKYRYYVLTVLTYILCLDVFFESVNNNFRWLSIQFWISQIGFSVKFGIEGNQSIELLSWCFSNVGDIIIETDIFSLLKLDIFICSLISIWVFFCLDLRYPKLVRFLTKNQNIQRKLLYYVKLPFLISLFTKSMPNFCQPSIAPVHNNFLWVWPKILLILDTWHLSKKNKLILPDIKEKLEYETIFFA